MGKQKVLFRADGDSEIGVGHIFRLMAVADMIKAEFNCAFLSRCDNASIIDSIKRVVPEFIQLRPDVSLEQEAYELTKNIFTGQEIMVIDGYTFDLKYQQSIKKRAFALICIDDIHTTRFAANAIVNHSPGIKPQDYKIESPTKFYLGTEYCMIRREFLKEARKTTQRSPQPSGELFLCIGGADAMNCTIPLLKIVKESPRVSTIHVVIGAAFRRSEELRAIMSQIQDKVVELHQNLEPKQLIEKIARCRWSICPASTIGYEIVSVRSGFIAGYYVDNQRNSYRGLMENEAAVGIGDLNSVTRDSVLEAVEKLSCDAYFEHIVRNQVQLIDGKSDERFRKLFNELP